MKQLQVIMFCSIFLLINLSYSYASVVYYPNPADFAQTAPFQLIEDEGVSAVDYAQVAPLRYDAKYSPADLVRIYANPGIINSPVDRSGSGNPIWRISLKSTY